MPICSPGTDACDESSRRAIHVLRYHSKTLQLLGMDPKPTRDSMRALEAVESRIGRRLPSSVREWYELEGACEILLRFSNDDPPLDARRLGTPEGDTREDG